MSNIPYTKNLVNKKFSKFIGDYTYGNPIILDWGEGAKIKIGKFCSIAEKVTIFLGGEHRIDWITTYPFMVNDDWPTAKKIKGHPKTKGDVIIGNDVWIGYGVTILSGVTIGDGAVIGSMSLITKDIEPYSIVGGIPSHLIKKRFDEETIKKLLKIKWWNWSETKINQNIIIFCSPNIEKIK